MSATTVSVLLILLFCVMAILTCREDVLLKKKRAKLAASVYSESQLSGQDAVKIKKRKLKALRYGRNVARWQFLWLVLLVFVGVILCAFRDTQNTYDTPNYVRMYLSWDVSSFSSFFKFSRDVEIGYEIISRIIKALFPGNIAIYFGTIAFIVLSLFAAAIWKLTDKRLAVFMLMYSIYGFYYSYIVLRQGIAMGIILYTVACIRKNKRFYIVKFLCGLIIAVLFHRSAIICIIMLPFLSGKIQINKLVIAIIFAIVCACIVYRNLVLIFAKFALWVSEFPLFSSVRSRINTYFSTSQLDTESKFSAVLVTFFIVGFLGKTKDVGEESWNIFMWFECIGMLIIGFLSGLDIVLRFGHYFIIFQCFLLPYSTRYVQSLGNKFIIILIALLYTYNMIGLTAAPQ